jgi:hypothetical protein
MSHTGLKRTGNDCFYTKPEISKKLVEELKKVIKFSNFDLIVEPSAGSGSFIDALGCKVTGYDIEPKRSDIIKQDFLELDTSTFVGKVLVVGNPPFGKNSSLAIKFIKKIAGFAQTFALVLPKSFKKQSRIDKIPLYFHKILEFDLPKNAFTIENAEVDVPCSFFVYEKKQYHRETFPKLQESSKYKIIKKCETIDKRVVAFRRVGANAGKFIYSDIQNLSKESHYFIHVIQDLDFDSCIFECDNTVGPRSISKQELISQLN